MEYGQQFKELLQHAACSNPKIRAEAISILSDFMGTPEFQKHIDIANFIKLLISVASCRDESSKKALIAIILLSGEESTLNSLYNANITDSIFQVLNEELKTAKFKEEKGIKFLKPGDSLDPSLNYSLIDMCFMLICNLTSTEKGIQQFIKDKSLKMHYVRKYLLWLCSFPDCDHFTFCACTLTNLTGIEKTKLDFDEAADVCKAFVDALNCGEGVVGYEMLKCIKNLAINKVSLDKVKQ